MNWTQKQTGIQCSWVKQKCYMCHSLDGQDYWSGHILCQLKSPYFSRVAPCRAYYSSPNRMTRAWVIKQRFSLTRKNHNQRTTSSWAKVLLARIATCSSFCGSATPSKTKNNKLRCRGAPYPLSLTRVQLKSVVLHPGLQSLQIWWKNESYLKVYCTK